MRTGYDDFHVPSVVERIEIDLTPPALQEDSESIIVHTATATVPCPEVGQVLRSCAMNGKGQTRILISKTPI